MVSVEKAVFLLPTHRDKGACSMNMASKNNDPSVLSTTYLKYLIGILEFFAIMLAICIKQGSMKLQYQEGVLNLN